MLEVGDAHGENMTKRKTTKTLNDAVEIFGGSQRALAKAAGVSQAAINKAVQKGGLVGPALARKVHDATEGKVPDYDLNPEIFRRA
jgi:DNA-binding transcriptional regulator YdaS (Cro superfamily)